MDLITLLLSGTTLATLIGLLTLRSTLRKASGEAGRACAEADKVEAEAETVRTLNTEHATRILIENIVTPLKTELNDTRRDLQSTKREMARFRKAIERATACRYASDCPVLERLRIEPTDADTERGGADSPTTETHLHPAGSAAREPPR